MPKSLKDILDGVKSSKTVPGSLGTKPGVDYDPKAGDERKFVAKHSMEKHDDRTGNRDDIYQASNIKKVSNKVTNKGRDKGEDEKVYEAKEVEEAKCNESPAGVYCPMHGRKKCSSVIREKQLISGKVAEDLAVPLLGDTDSYNHHDEALEMAKTQLRALANKAMHLVMAMTDDMHVEPWVQSKIAVAKDNVSAVHDYLIYGDHQKPEDEQTSPYDGGIDIPPSSGMVPGTFPNFSVDVNTGRNV